MPTIDVHEAQTQLPQLLKRAVAGETVLIAEGGHSLVQLVAMGRPSGERRLGTLAGRIWVGDDFDDPLPEELLNAFEGRGG